MYACREDFPGGPVVKNLPASAGHAGSISGPGRFHTPLSQLSPCTQLLKPSFLEPLLFNEKPMQHEACTPQLEKSLRSIEDPAQPKQKQKNF